MGVNNGQNWYKKRKYTPPCSCKWFFYTKQLTLAMTLEQNPKISGYMTKSRWKKSRGMEGTFCVYISVFPMNKHRCQKNILDVDFHSLKYFGTSGPEELQNSMDEPPASFSH